LVEAYFLGHPVYYRGQHKKIMNMHQTLGTATKAAAERKKNQVFVTGWVIFVYYSRCRNDWSLKKYMDFQGDPGRRIIQI